MKPVLIVFRLFQFLIGSLEAASSLAKWLYENGFQFLIGSLEARSARVIASWSRFQFLIGSLEARREV
mgnify:CR=1 FL=1